MTHYDYIVIGAGSAGCQDHLLVSVVQETTQDVHSAITSNGVEAGLFLHSSQ